MQLRGAILITCPAKRVLNALHSPEVLASLVPGECEMVQTSATEYPFTIRRKFGPVALTLPGTLTITPQTEDTYVFALKAAHFLGGKIEMTMTIGVVAAQGVSRLGYEAELEASGLAGRILDDRSDQIEAGIEARLNRLKKRLEKGDKRSATAKMKADARA